MSSVGNVTQASVQRPAMTNFLRPVAATALRNPASSQEFIEVRSMRAWFGNSSITSGMNGPEKESLATVVSTVGILNSFAALAGIWMLLKTTIRSWDWTPWYMAG